jgi:hypothetical protein
MSESKKKGEITFSGSIDVRYNLLSLEQNLMTKRESALESGMFY